MSLDTLIMFAGAVIALLPFSGFPQEWDRVILVIVGVFVIALGIVVRRRMPRTTPRTFVESAPKQH
jgi:drug/metabolite transporter (DMT)-like permease